MQEKRNHMEKTQKYVIQLCFAIAGAFSTLFAIVMFNLYLLPKCSLLMRITLTIIMPWLLVLVPVLFMKANKETWKDIGFTKEKIPLQVLIGILIAIIMSLVLAVIPIIFGFKEMLGGNSYTKVWQFVYCFVYYTLGVALPEEIIFRGYVFKKLLDIKNSKRFAMIVSSVLFGLFHMFSGNIIQIVITTLIGLFLCLSREKIKNCTTLSLIFAHGFYDALIVLWVAVLP
jgi:membrane protease YdiL (CAAX protease family)